MACSLDQLLLRAGESANGQDTGALLLTAHEAERMVEQLKAFPIEQYGSPKFLEQHDWIVQLNLQAHHNAMVHSDEFVMEALVSHSQVDTLVHNLLVAEAWRESVYPLLREHLAKRVDSVISWSMLFHETAVANLLEVALYHRSACEAASEDMLLELTDWAYRKLTYLNSDAHKYVSGLCKERSATQLLSQSPGEELDERCAEVAWGAGMCGLTIARYLTEHVTSLPLGVMARLVSSNDTIMALLPLVDHPPWVRTVKGQLEKFVDGRWQAVAPLDRLKVVQADAQVWLALHNLLLEPSCRAKYDPDEYRREVLQRLRRHLNELLLDQLPCLKDLQRLLDEMSVGADTAPHGAEQWFSGRGSDQGTARGGGSGRAARLILEQVPTVREGIVKGRDWGRLAAHIKESWLGDAAQRLARERAERMLKSFEFLCSLEPGGKGEGLSGSGQGGGNADSSKLHNGKGASGWGSGADEGAVRVECWRRVRAGVFERWCEFSCEIDKGRAAEPVVVTGEGEVTVKGVRHRLVGSEVGSRRPLPCDGKVVVRYMGHKAQAQLQLPTVAVRSQDETPAGLWLTVGLLAIDGLALQLRLKRAAKPVERDPVAGVWYVYHPVGGAITLLQEQDKGPDDRTAAESRGAEAPRKVLSGGLI